MVLFVIFDAKNTGQHAHKNNITTGQPSTIMALTVAQQ